MPGPPNPVYRPLMNAQAWRRDTFRSAADYTVELTEAERSELDAAAERGDFRLPLLGPKLRAAYEEVRSGRGFVVLRGLPLEGGLERFMAAVWGVGTHFGQALSQNAAGELIGHVIDASAQEETPRMFRSNLELRLHTDITAMIALACWHDAREGGASFLASAATIHEEIARRAPHLLEPLYRGYHYHRLGEEGPGEEPVAPYRAPVLTVRNGQVSCRYQRTSIAGGHRALGIPLTETDLAAFDLFDEVARAPENRFAFSLQRGEMVVINNYAVMHARTKFTEWPEPERRRHLVRLWLDAPGFRDVPREYNLFATNGVPPQPGRSCTFDFKQLYRDDPRATGGMPRTDLDELQRAQ